VSDPLKGKYTQARYFKREFEMAKERLAPLGGEVKPGEHDYQAFVYQAPGLRLIFYPHKTTAGNYHIRVRAEGKADPKQLEAAIFALAENTCTFNFPAHSEIHHKAVMASIERRLNESPRNGRA